MLDTLSRLCHFGVDRQGYVTFAPTDEGELGSELFDTNYSTARIRPWDERRRQAFAVSQGFYEVYHRTGDARIERIASAGVSCGTDLRFQELHCERAEVTKLRLKRANFCRARLCPLCNWRRSLRLKHELGRVLDAVLAEEPDLRLVMLTLTVPNPSYDDFGQAIGELKTAVGRLMRYKRIQDAVRHWFRALEVTCPRPRELHPHYHILLLVPPVYFDPDHDLYIEWSEWKALWRRALNADADRIIDIRATDNPNEVAKYVAKPSAYVALTGEEWRCDSLVLETLHYGLASRRMIAWSRSLSEIRRRLGFLELKEGEELIDVGDEDDGLEWEPVRILTYRWRCADGRWSYRLTNICTASWGDDEIEAPWTYYGSG